MKRKSILAALIVLLLAVVAWGVLRRTAIIVAAPGSGAIEQWCGSQLLAIANAHLGPELAFESLDYQYPATVVLGEVSLRTPEVDLIVAESIQVDFAELPKVGRPIVIEAIVLRRPVVRLVRKPGGGLEGFSGLVKSSGGDSAADGGSTRPSDVFAIHEIRVIDGAVQYENTGRPPMRLDQLTFALIGEPDAGDPGWYRFDARVGRPPVLDLDVDARLNIDTAQLELLGVTARLAVAPSQYQVLPPELQSILRRRGEPMTGIWLACVRIGGTCRWSLTVTVGDCSPFRPSGGPHTGRTWRRCLMVSSMATSTMRTCSLRTVSSVASSISLTRCTIL